MCLNFAVNGRESATLGAILFPPNATVDKVTNECVGQSIELTRTILAFDEIDLEVVCASAIRIYKMLEVGEVDFTINIKSTRALADNVIFSDIPYQMLTLNLYSYNNAQNVKTVAAIRGFDYHGNRQKMTRNGYEFFDLPNSISAIQVFVKQRSGHLISYAGPVNYYQQAQTSWPKEGVEISSILEVDTFYAVAKSSAKSSRLLKTFNNFAAQKKLRYFLDLAEKTP